MVAVRLRLKPTGRVFHRKGVNEIIIISAPIGQSARSAGSLSAVGEALGSLPDWRFAAIRLAQLHRRPGRRRPRAFLPFSSSARTFGSRLSRIQAVEQEVTEITEGLQWGQTGSWLVLRPSPDSDRPEDTNATSKPPQSQPGPDQFRNPKKAFSDGLAAFRRDFWFASSF